MIGLGSNRLSVCRRGGMRVTQAGRGGMEWLAGGRVPSWASPYSAQATAALKAQFPTQWPTIRDYGFAHPEIVPWVEANPILYGTLISLGEKPIGIAYSNGNSWVDITNLQSSALSQVDCDVIMRTSSANQPICGGDTGYGCLWYDPTGNFYFRNNRGQRYRYDGVNPDTHYTVVATNDSITVNGNAGYLWNSSGDLYSGIVHIFNGAVRYNGGQRMVGGISRFFINNEAYKLYPVMRNGDAGLYDMVSGNFYANAGTEPFTVGASWQAS